MPKIIKIIILVIIGVLALPVLTLGGSMTVSLIQGKSVEESLQAVAEQTDMVIGKISLLEVRADKETACRKAEELKNAPEETKILSYSEQKGTPIYSKSGPDTTEELLTYLLEYMQNYTATGSIYYTRIPDYTPELAQKYITILQGRLQEYLIQQELCNK